MEGYLGQIILFPKRWLPLNWEVCDGKLMDSKRYVALFAVLGEEYKRDEDNFVLPIIDSPHSDFVYIICVDGVFPQRH